MSFGFNSFGVLGSPAPTFGSTPNSNPFGGAAIKPLNLFGSSTQSAPAFGSAPSAAPSAPFGSAPAFGAPNPAFGNAGTFGNNTPAFGQSTPTSSNPFGQPGAPAASSNPFGQPAAPAFGSPSALGGNAPAFGSQLGAAPAFGATSSFGGSAPAFGATSALGGSAPAFGATSALGGSAPAFGASAPAFGATSTLGGGAPAFGATSALGAAAPAFGATSTFGGAPAFGSPSSLGSAPAFGSTSALGGNAPAFGAGGASFNNHLQSQGLGSGTPAFGQAAPVQPGANPFLANNTGDLNKQQSFFGTATPPKSPTTFGAPGGAAPNPFLPAAAAPVAPAPGAGTFAVPAFDTQEPAKDFFGKPVVAETKKDFFGKPVEPAKAEPAKDFFGKPIEPAKAEPAKDFFGKPIEPAKAEPAKDFFGKPIEAPTAEPKKDFFGKPVESAKAEPAKDFFGKALDAAGTAAPKTDFFGKPVEAAKPAPKTDFFGKPISDAKAAETDKGSDKPIVFGQTAESKSDGAANNLFGKSLFDAKPDGGVKTETKSSSFLSLSPVKKPDSSKHSPNQSHVNEEEEDTPPASKRKSPRLEAAPQISLAPTGNLALPPAKATVFGSGTFGTSGTPAVSAVAAAAPPTPVAAKAAIIVPPAAPASLPALPAIKKFVSKPHAAVSTSSVPAIQPKIVTATADHAFGQALAFSVYRDMSPPSSNSSGLQSQTACMLENGVFLTVGTWNSELEIRGINLRLLRRNLQAANDELKSEQCAKCHESNVVVDCTSCSLRLCARCDLKLHADEATVAHSRTEVQSASAVEAAKQTPVLLMRPSSRSLNASAYQQIIGNSFGNRALLVGNSELAVLSLPKRRLESENVAEGAELHSVAEIQCAQCPFFADTKTIAQGVTVIQAAWHPLSDSHIVVLCSDRALRVFDIRTWSQANVVEPEQTFSLTAHEASSSDFVGFSFGSDAGMKQLLTGSKETSFIVEAFSIYLLHSNGNLYSLCPVVPRGFLLSIGQRDSLRRECTSLVQSLQSGRAAESNASSLTLIESWFQRCWHTPLGSGSNSTVEFTGTGGIDLTAGLQGPLRVLPLTENKQTFASAPPLFEADAPASKSLRPANSATSLISVPSAVAGPTVLFTAWLSGHVDSFVAYPPQVPRFSSSLATAASCPMLGCARVSIGPSVELHAQFLDGAQAALSRGRVPLGAPSLLHGRLGALATSAAFLRSTHGLHRLHAAWIRPVRATFAAFRAGDSGTIKSVREALKKYGTEALPSSNRTAKSACVAVLDEAPGSQCLISLNDAVPTAFPLLAPLQFASAANVSDDVSSSENDEAIFGTQMPSFESIREAAFAELGLERTADGRLDLDLARQTLLPTLAQARAINLAQPNEQQIREFSEVLMPRYFTALEVLERLHQQGQQRAQIINTLVTDVRTPLLESIRQSHAALQERCKSTIAAFEAVQQRSTQLHQAVQVAASMSDSIAQTLSADQRKFVDSVRSKSVEFNQMRDRLAAAKQRAQAQLDALHAERARPSVNLNADVSQYCTQTRPVEEPRLSSSDEARIKKELLELGALVQQNLTSLRQAQSGGRQNMLPIEQEIVLSLEAHHNAEGRFSALDADDDSDNENTLVVPAAASHSLDAPTTALSIAVQRLAQRTEQISLQVPPPLFFASPNKPLVLTDALQAMSLQHESGVSSPTGSRSPKNVAAVNTPIQPANPAATVLVEGQKGPLYAPLASKSAVKARATPSAAPAFLSSPQVFRNTPQKPKQQTVSTPSQLQIKPTPDWLGSMSAQPHAGTPAASTPVSSTPNKTTQSTPLPLPAVRPAASLAQRLNLFSPARVK